MTRRYPLRDDARRLAYRTAFQRDRDRILHSQAFRRLKHKTQVFVAYEGDHHRTRLTHTLEVAQLARTIARALALNEDLAEAIALGHDLGQPPFGAAGEEILAAILTGRERVAFLEPEVARATGGFRPNQQSLRVIDRLEARYEHPGINLSDPVREGILKCGPVDETVRYPDVDPEGLALGEPPELEAQVVIVADRLARLTHDLEDGIRSGEVAITAVERSAIGRTVMQKLGDAYPEAAGIFRRRNAQVRGIIHLLVSDVVVHSGERLHAWLASGTPAGARLPAGTIGLSERVAELAEDLEELVRVHIYRSRTVRRLEARARTFLTGLFAAYYQDPLQLDDYALLRYRAEAGGPFLRDVPEERVDAEIEARYQNRPAFVRLIADHVAGMSDTYALREYERLYLPFPEADRRI